MPLFDRLHCRRPRRPVVDVVHCADAAVQRVGVVSKRLTCDVVRGVGKCNERCFFEKVKSSPAPIHVLSSRIRTVEENLTSPRCWNRTCLFPSRAARFAWWLTSRHRSHLFDILSLSKSFQQRHAITPHVFGQRCQVLKYRC